MFAELARKVGGRAERWEGVKAEAGDAGNGERPKGGAVEGRGEAKEAKTVAMG
jgi:hypothetical protein